MSTGKTNPGCRQKCFLPKRSLKQDPCNFASVLDISCARKYPQAKTVHVPQWQDAKRDEKRNEGHQKRRTCGTVKQRLPSWRAAAASARGCFFSFRCSCSLATANAVITCRHGQRFEVIKWAPRHTIATKEQICHIRNILVNTHAPSQKDTVRHCHRSYMVSLAWIWRVQQGVGLWQPFTAACLQDTPCSLAGKVCSNNSNTWSRRA